MKSPGSLRSPAGGGASALRSKSPTENQRGTPWRMALAGLASVASLLAACGEAPTEVPNGQETQVGEATQAITCTTLFPSGDATIAQDPADPTAAVSNFGAALTLGTGTTGTTVRQSLLQFSFGTLPPLAVITSSTLSLRKAAGVGGGTLTAHRVIAPWAEPAVTWSSFGGAFDGTAAGNLDLATVLPNTTGTFDVTALVQAWVTGQTPNYGVLLEQPSGRATFGSRNAGNVPLRPQLKVCYVPQSCSDGQQNGTETGVDCGGLCAACPTCSDGIQNQGEGGIDCDGPCVPCAGCPAGFGGPGCATNLDDCTPNPCQNGGSCVDGVASYTCVCPVGWAGTDCQTPVGNAACAGLDTNNDGLILVPELNACLGTLGAFSGVQYIEVAYGNTSYLDNVCGAFGYGAYAGTHGGDQCSSSAYMYPSYCGQGWNSPNGCSNGCGNANYDGFYCTNNCPAGYGGVNCATNLDECASNPCQNGGTCADGIASYTCTCPAGWAGTNCQQQVIAQNCVGLDTNNDGLILVSELNSCLGALGAFSGVQYIEVAYGNTSYLDNVCNAFGYGGYAGTHGGDQCNSGAYMYPSYCGQGWNSVNGCFNGCGNANYDGFYCANNCPAGYGGLNCATNLDDCASNPCQNGGTCVDGVASYTCTCPAGWTGTNCQQQVFAQNCQGLDANGDALITVAELNSCLGAIGAFSGVQYIEVAYGNTSYLDNVCNAFGYGAYAGTHGGDQCSSSAYMYPSYCGQGWNSPNGCSNGCGNANYDGFYCTNNCPAGYGGVNCATNLDECASNPCQNGGTCVDGIASYTCTCPAGWTGTNCQQQVIAQSCVGLDANNDGLILVSELNSCLGALGAFSGVQYIEVAYGNTSYLDNVCNAFGYGPYAGTHGGDQCSSGAYMYPSYCGQGWNSPNSCFNGCGNANYDGFYCTNNCPAGYGGVNCATNLDDCASNPCQNGGTCADGIASYTCACPAGWTGTNCQTQVIASTCGAFDVGGDKLILVSELNSCLGAFGAFSGVQYIEVAYGNTSYLDNVCNAFGYGTYAGPHGGDQCSSGAYMYPSYCGQGWNSPNSCFNGCGNTNYDGFYCN
jgi:hypothetical protein